RDALGLVTRAETKDGSSQTVVAYDYSYDPAKRLQTVTDSRGGKTLTYVWTPGGRLAMVQDSDGNQASLAYDPTGRLASVTTPNGETIGFTYDAGGRLVETRLNSGQRTTQSWFEDGNLKQRQNLYNATVLSGHLYSLDNQGRRAGQTEVIGGTTKTWSYLYDNLDRLTSASDGTAETYGYDIFGNRRSKTKSGVTTAYLYDLAQQLTEIRSGSDTGTLIGAAVHDADGHMVKLCEVSTGGTVTKPTGDCTASGNGATTLALVWDALDHLNTATRTGVGAVTESYAYDDQGRRISKTSGATTASYLYDGDDIHAEWTGAISGNPAAVYVQGAGTDEPLLRLTGQTNSPAAPEAAYLQDGLGSVVGLANTVGTLTANQRFDAWGNKLSSSGTTPTYGYTGREPDATGLEFYRNRYYHPGLGRFASRDPMGMADAVSPYAYVQNNPVNLIDPLGFMATDPVKLAGLSGLSQYWGVTSDWVGSTFDTAKSSARVGYNTLLDALPGARPPDGNGSLTLGEANYQYRHGEGQSVTVDLNKIDFSGVSAAGAQAKASPGGISYVTPSSANDFLVHGTVGVRVQPNQTITAPPGPYDFDIHPLTGDLSANGVLQNAKIIVRNIETVIGNVAAGFGTPFIINYGGQGKVGKP
ncbi:RHS repeat-associated core domain-containing protein, partial [Thiobacillus sp.]